MGTTKTKMQDLDGYDEIIEMILNGVPRDKLMPMLPVEERLAGLELEACLRALPVEVLRGLSTDFIATLPEDVQAEIRRRIDA